MPSPAEYKYYQSIFPLRKRWEELSDIIGPLETVGDLFRLHDGGAVAAVKLIQDVRAEIAKHEAIRLRIIADT